MRWLLLGLCLALGTPTHAHTLEVTTAQITLRDGQIAVSAHIDVLALMQTLKTPDDAPLGLLAVADPAVFDALAEQARITLQAHTHLSVDGTSVTPVDWRFPSLDHLRAEAQRAWMAEAMQDHVHATFSPISFGAQLTRAPSKVELALPPEVGPVLMSFVQPVSQLAQPGAAVTVLVPPRSLSLAPASAPRGHAAAP